MTEEREETSASGEDVVRSASIKSKEKDAKDKEKDRKTTRNKPLTKIIIRRLPPSMTEESFLEQVSPIPEHDYFCFAKPDPSLTHCGFSRAYINFVNLEDIYLFKDKFDGYIFLDEKGLEYVGIVEYSPFQRIPKKRRKKDPKCGTVESDPAYLEFLESLKEPEGESREPKLEYSYQVNDNHDKKATSTPLLEYLAARKLDKRGREERRRRDTDKRKVRVDRKTKEAPIREEGSPESEVKKIKSRDWEKDKPSPKKKEEEAKPAEGKDMKTAAGKPVKSYREQRKLAEEQRRRTDGEKKEFRSKDANYNEEKPFRKDKRDKPRESPKEQKPKEVKKYSDTRRERTKYDKKDEATDSTENSVEAEKSERKPSKPLNHNDIKPFTQLPQVKTEDLTKVIEEMDRLMKLEEQGNEPKPSKEEKISESSSSNENSEDKPTKVEAQKTSRRKSLDLSDPLKEEPLKRQNSLTDRSKSIDRDDSVEKDKSGGSDPRTERRIRNKDRPSLAIYQPGMGKFSKQRIAKDKESPQGGAGKLEAEVQDKKDT